MTRVEGVALGGAGRHGRVTLGMASGSPEAHVIRLRGPWTVLERGGGQVGRAGETTVRLPACWSDLRRLGPGRIRLARRFHRPTGLDRDTRVHLVAEAWPRSVGVFLDGHPLGQLAPASCPARWDVTDRLREGNRVEVELVLQGPVEEAREVADREEGAGGRPVGQFWLEISTGRKP